MGCPESPAGHPLFHLSLSGILAVQSKIHDLLVTARPSHWLKNVFVFAPLVFAVRLDDGGDVLRSFGLFGVFSVLASGVYFFNDAVDAPMDRRHPSKSERPVAAGRITRARAATVGVFLGGSALALSIPIGLGVTLVLGIYAVLTVAYSLWLRRIALIDSMAVAAGFVLRAIAGAVVIAVPFSAWLVLCTFFLALLMALGKRRTELLLEASRISDTRPAMRGLSLEVLDAIITVVASVTVVSYAIYSLAPDTTARLGGGMLVFTVPLVLYGIARYLLRVFSGVGTEDPTKVVLQDRGLQVALLAWTAVTIVTIYRAGPWLSEFLR